LLIVGVRPGVIAAVVVLVVVVVVVVVGNVLDPNRLRRHEQWLVVGTFGGVLDGLEHQPRLGLISIGFGRRWPRLDFSGRSLCAEAGFGLIGLLSRRLHVQRVGLTVLRGLCLF
jgi:hypothetical protein